MDDNKNYARPDRYKQHKARRRVGTRGAAGLFPVAVPAREGEPWTVDENYKLIRLAVRHGARGRLLPRRVAHELVPEFQRSEDSLASQYWKIKQGTPEAPARKKVR